MERDKAQQLPGDLEEDELADLDFLRQNTHDTAASLPLLESPSAKRGRAGTQFSKQSSFKLLQSRLQKQSLLGFLEPSLRTEPTSVILSLQQPHPTSQPMFYRVETRDNQEMLVADGAEVCALDSSLRVAVNPSSIDLFEQHHIETMVHNALAGFNLCLVLMGSSAGSRPSRLSTEPRRMSTMKQQLAKTPGHHLTFVPARAHCETGIVKHIFEAIFAFIHEVSRSRFNSHVRITMRSLRFSCRSPES